MADLVRGHNWADTPLGPIAGWPELLICSVNLLLCSQFPCAIFWGSQLTQIYNDAYVSVIGQKHPRALGQSAPECWNESWHIAGPQIEAALRGESIYLKNVLIPVNREGAIENVYWTYSSSPLYSASGTVQGVLTICHDVTAEVVAIRERDELIQQLNQVISETRSVNARLESMKSAEAALRESEKLASVGRLAASIAHEINNPLEAVTNLVYLALQTSEVNPIHGYLDLAQRELHRVSNITSQTLRFYRQSNEPTAVACDELIDDVLAIQHARILRSRVNVEQRMRADKTINCINGEIRQVLNNLIGNAIDAMQQTGGRLLIRSREATCWSRQNRGIVVTIADTGTGIHHDDLSRIFEPYFSTKGVGGTGLGLWVSREIVERHRGILRVRSSQRPGRTGTIFKLYLPFNGLSKRAAA
ncbi:MAG: PAS domain-containing protein [Silvibacterium sp.]|nr:PAS domain-containing protein [Silvibacterium sp.]